MNASDNRLNPNMPALPASTQKPAPKKKKKSEVRLPFLLEMVCRAPIVILIVIGLVVTVLSILSGSPLWVVALRGGVSVLVVGVIFWFLSWMISQGYLEMMVEKAKEEAAQKLNPDDDSESTMEIKA